MPAVQIELPDRVWGRLASVAEHRGVKVRDLFESALRWLIADDESPLDALLLSLKVARSSGWRSPRVRGASLRVERPSFQECTDGLADAMRRGDVAALARWADAAMPGWESKLTDWKETA